VMQATAVTHGHTARLVHLVEAKTPAVGFDHRTSERFRRSVCLTRRAAIFEPLTSTPFSKAQRCSW
jgi:hypothetical protein